MYEKNNSLENRSPFLFSLLAETIRCTCAQKVVYLDKRTDRTYWFVRDCGISGYLKDKRMKKINLILVTGILLGGCAGSQKKTVPNHLFHMNTTTTGGGTITLKGDTIHTIGKLPAVGSQAPDFKLTGVDLSEKKLKDFAGKNIILNIFISVNTGVCSASVHQFNQDAAGLKNSVVLCISKDLPFAQKEFCGAEGINNVVMLSDFRDDFGKTYGVLMTDGKMRGLLSRAVVVIDPQGKVAYEQQVPDISHKPDYAAALAAIR